MSSLNLHRQGVERADDIQREVCCVAPVSGSGSVPKIVSVVLGRAGTSQGRRCEGIEAGQASEKKGNNVAIKFGKKGQNSTEVHVSCGNGGRG